MNAYPAMNHPADRLHVSNIGFKQRHVYEIALELSRNHSVSLPDYFSDKSQDWMANWIIQKFGFDRNLIKIAHETVRARIPGAKIYRKGRPPGSKNRNKYYTPPTAPQADDADPFDDLPEATHAAPILETPTTQQPTHPTLDLSAYALKSDLHRMSDNITAALKSYTEGNFTKLFDAQNELANKHNTLIDIVQRLELQRPTVVSLERRELPSLELGVVHRNFPKLLKMCNAAMRNGSHLNIWIYGPAGTGKSTAAEKVAEALSLPFHTNGKLATEYAVLGFINTTGYQTTEFRKAYEHGGIYLADEIDGSMPDALLALNGALANGHCVFPDKIIKRNPNFLFLAAANTTGTGATIDYVGRFKQDAAFNDRFVFLDWPLDEALEDSLVANKDWLKIVRIVRTKIISQGIKGHLITPRASLYGESLLAADLTLDEVMQSVLKKGLSDAQWMQVKP